MCMLQMAICKDIPDRYLRSLADREACLSQGYCGPLASNAGIVLVTSQEQGKQGDNARLVQEGHRSQSAFALHHSNNNDCDDFNNNNDGDYYKDSGGNDYNNNGDDYNNNVGDNYNNNDDYNNSNRHAVTSVVCAGFIDNQSKSLYVSVQPIVQDLGKAAEADKTLCDNMNKRMLDIWENTMAEYNEFVCRK
jgi:hypothetical protein